MAGPMGGRGPGRGRDFKEKEKPKDIKSTMKKLMRYIGYSKNLFISSLIVILIVTGLNLLTPVLQSEALGAITLDENNNIDTNKFSLYLLLMLIAYITVAIFSFFQNYISPNSPLLLLNKGVIFFIINELAKIVKTVDAKVINVNDQLLIIIITKVPIIVTIPLTKEAIDCEIVLETFSTSFVILLIKSPWLCVSINLIGNFVNFVKRSFLIFLTVTCDNLAEI